MGAGITDVCHLVQHAMTHVWRADNSLLESLTSYHMDGSWGSYSNCQTWLQLPLLVEQSHQLQNTIYLSVHISISLFLNKILLFIYCVCVCEHIHIRVHVRMTMEYREGDRFLEVGFQLVLSCLIRVLKMELGSFGRVIMGLHSWAIPVATEHSS